METKAQFDRKLKITEFQKNNSRTRWKRVLTSLIVLALLTLGLIMNVYDPLQARGYWNWRAASNKLRTIHAAQGIYFERSSPQRFASLQELADEGYIEQIVADGQYHGYFIEMRRRTIQGKHEFWAKASPIKPGETGDLFYYINQDGVLYESARDFKGDFFHNNQRPSDFKDLSGPDR